MDKTRHSRRKLVWLLLAVTALWLVFTAARSYLLLEQGQRIARASAKFQRDYFVGHPGSRPFTYLVMGDSTAAGWGARQLEATYPYRIAETISKRGYRVRVVNLAIGGATLRDVCEKQLPQLDRFHPDLITLGFGANDATHSTSDSDYSNDLKILLSALKHSEAEQILIANTPDMYQAPALALPLAITANRRAIGLNSILDAALRGSTTRLSTMRQVDLYRQGKLIYRRNKNLYAADLFHPSDDGYRLWAEMFVQQLNKR